MTIREKHIARRWRARRGAFAAFVAGVAALCCVACINEYPDAAPQVQGPSLALMVSFPDIVDNPDDAVSPVERMHNLRVIITHNTDDGKEEIEYNRFIDFNDTEGKYKYGYLEDLRLIFLVRQEWIGKARNVYLFANSEPIFDRMFTEEGLSGHLDPEEGAYGGNHRVAFSEDITDKYLAAIKNVTFTNDELQEFVKPEKGGTPNGIPMSAEYRDVEFEPGNTGIANISVFNSYIVRAANKITFTYTNTRPFRDILVQNWGLMKVNKRAYLLPHVLDNETNQTLFGAATEYGGNWIAWYAKHINAGTHVDELDFDVPKPGDSNLGMGPYFGVNKEWSSNVGPITQEDNRYKHYYDVVEEDLPSSMSERYGRYLPRRFRDGTTQESSHFDTYSEPIYFLETMGSRSQGGITGSSVPLYHMQFGTLYQQYQQNGNPTGNLEPGDNTAQYLDRVKTLFRNTHVHVDVVFGDANSIDLYAEVEPWQYDSTVFSGNLNEEGGGN